MKTQYLFHLIEPTSPTSPPSHSLDFQDFFVKTVDNWKLEAYRAMTGAAHVLRGGDIGIVPFSK